MPIPFISEVRQAQLLSRERWHSGQCSEGRCFQPPQQQRFFQSDVAVAREMVTNISPGLLPSTHSSRTSTPDSDQPPPILRNQANLQHHRTAGGSTVYRGPGNLWSFIKKKKKLIQPGDFFLFWRQKMEKEGGGTTGKKNRSTIQWYIPNFCHSAQVVPCPHSKVHGPLGLSRLCGPVRGTAAWSLPAPGH